MTLQQTLDADLSGIMSYDLPKVITIGGSSVTGLVEDVRREEQNDLGGYNLTLSTRLHIRTAELSNAPTIGIVCVVDGVDKRVVSHVKTLDGNAWIIDVDDPG